MSCLLCPLLPLTPPTSSTPLYERTAPAAEYCQQALFTRCSKPRNSAASGCCATEVGLTGGKDGGWAWRWCKYSLEGAWWSRCTSTVVLLWGFKYYWMVDVYFCASTTTASAIKPQSPSWLPATVWRLTAYAKKDTGSFLTRAIFFQSVFSARRRFFANMKFQRI